MQMYLVVVVIRPKLLLERIASPAAFSAKNIFDNHIVLKNS